MNDWISWILVANLLLLARVAYMIAKAEANQERISEQVGSLLLHQHKDRFNGDRDLVARKENQVIIDVINARFQEVESEYKFEMPKLKKDLEDMMGEIQKISMDVDELRKVQYAIETAIDRLD